MCFIQRGGNFLAHKPHIAKPFSVINLPLMYVILKYKANIFVFYFNLLFLLKIFYGKKSNYSKIIR